MVTPVGEPTNDVVPLLPAAVVGTLCCAEWTMVAGAAALILQAKPTAKSGDINNVLSKAQKVNDMGYGRIDLFQSLTTLVNSIPSSPNSGAAR